MSCHSSGSSRIENEDDPRVYLTESRVDWDNLSALACRLLQVPSASWGDSTSGACNLVRFLHLDDAEKTTIVARVPLCRVGSSTPEQYNALCNRMSSEVATMEYIETYTRIPIPHVIHYCVEADGSGVGSPYILMSKIDGVSLCSVWDDMDDTKRHAVLRQIVAIILELSSQRFDKIGALFKRDGVGKDAWYIKPMLYILDPDDPTPYLLASSVTYTNGASYWLALASANIQSINDDHFGTSSKADGYAQAWFLRSLVPALCDNSLDITGFPLQPGDFHSQNIFITDVDSQEPRVTGVIDWEWSSALPTASFAQYPLFIVDHPLWPDDHPLRQRNVHDQATFNELMHTAERSAHPESDLSLSRAFTNSLGPYLFQQCIQDPLMYTILYPQLFDYVFGNGADEEFSVDYYIALMEKGLLRKETEQFDQEAKVWQETKDVLGEELVHLGLSRVGFKVLVLENEDQFPVDGLVRNWLAAIE